LRQDELDDEGPESALGPQKNGDTLTRGGSQSARNLLIFRSLIPQVYVRIARRSRVPIDAC
jgi:hypothetical protein